MPELRSFPRVVGSLTGVLVLLMACTEHPPQAAGSQTCTSQIIVSFAQGVPVPPDESLVKDLARVAGVNLAYVRAVTPELHLFSLSAVGDDCGKAVERLRQDPRVRSADIDQRRQHH